MRANVLTDAALGRYAGRFVWLSVNTEAAANAAFLKKYPIPVLPTLLVLDAKGDRVTMRYAGGASVAQLSKMLDNAERAYRARTQSPADALLVRADQLSTQGKHLEAADAYDEAIAKAPKSWNGLGRAAESLVFSLTMASKNDRCAQRALALYPRLKGTTSSANVAATGLSCALAADEEQKTRSDWTAALEKATRATFDDPRIELSGDDRAGLYGALIDAREAAKDEAAAAQLRSEWAAFLEKAAGAAKTPSQRTAYDSWFVNAYLALGTPEKALPWLERSERDFPDDYNPPARLALIYKAMKQYDQALAASDRALAKVYGPRKLIVLSARADIQLAKGDKEAARQTIADAVAFAKSLPEGQRSEARIASLEKRLASMTQ
ncbi:MAG TPA: thiol reductase thioredoxin [Thermoanaerobaculia bacterium]|jgi:tetratricopeptide (TPR) repeat protein